LIMANAEIIGYLKSVINNTFRFSCNDIIAIVDNRTNSVLKFIAKANF